MLAHQGDYKGTPLLFEKIPTKSTMLMKKLLFLLFIFSIVACGPIETPTPTVDSQDSSTPEVEATQPPASSEGYPPPAAEPEPNVNEAYPPATSSTNETNSVEGAYPAQPTRFIDESKRFTFNEPLRANQEEVSGNGPADIPIKVISISSAGESLGLGSTESDGTFSITLSRPLQERELIAIQLGDDSLRADFRDAPGTDMPLIGLVFGQTLVQP